MERKFGIELEIINISKEKAVRALRAVGINVQPEGYNHTTRNHWKVITDGSVSNGYEVVSPVLEGEAGLQEARIVANALADADATVNSSCGFHVHFDASNFTKEVVFAIVSRYAKFESQIDAFMPMSRRANNNRYCHSCSRFTSRLNSRHTIQDMANIQDSRYFKVNLQSYQRHGTIEFRQHSGTTNANKIENWVRFLDAFITTCQNPAQELQANNLPSLTGVQGRLVSLLSSGETVSLARICEEFSCLEKSARAMITRLRKVGFNIVLADRGENSSYKMCGEVQSDSLWAGIAQNIMQFYQNRASVLAL